MKRRLLPMMMTLVLVCALPIWAAFVTSGDVTNPLVSTAAASELTLQAKIDAAADNATITLDSDTTITETLVITGKTLTLDLNGCTLRMTGTGSVLKVSGRATLTITDSSAAKSGTITGGNAKDGGGVYVEAYATLEMTGGCITGCRAKDGGGVYIDNNATLKMTGGCITDCHASRGGGGIYSSGNLYMSGTAKIEKCTSNGGSYDAIWNRERCSIYADGGTVDGTVNNQGTIKHSNGVTAVTVFEKAVYNQAKKIIEDGIYKGTVENTGTITGGTFYGSIVNEVGPEQVTDSAKVAVTFNTDGGTSVAEEKVLRGQKMSKPAAPTKSGYTFTGWEDANGAYDFNTPVIAPLTLTAKWEEVPSSGGNYYYHPTTDTKADDAKGSPKTADPGVALYGVLSLLSLTGLTCITKKR